MKLFIGCLFGLVVLGNVLRADAAPRVALMDFATDDNSYRSAQLAADFTTLLQASLAGEPEVDWVERAQLDKARQELELSAAELVGGGATVQRGKWVKADWMITGQFSLDDKNQRTLSLEVTDLKHADALASKTITFPGTAAPQFQIATNQIGMAMEALHQLLSAARQRELQSADKILIAPLFLADVTGFGAGFGFNQNKISFEQELNEALERATATNGRVQLIRFPKAYRSTEESEMVLDGLVAADQNAWQQTADLYVWGTFASKRKMTPGKRPEETTEITLHLWDGASQPIVLQEMLPGDAQPQQIQAVLERLAGQVIADAHRHTAQVDSGAIRKRIAQSLVETYDEMTLRFHHREELGLNDPEKFLQAVHMLETACFFDPDNANARILYITCRWGWWMDFGFKVKNQFWSKWRRSVALGKYVNRFGLKPVTEELPFPFQQEGGIPSMYVRSLADVAAMFPQWRDTNDMALEDEWRQQGTHTWLMEAEFHGFPKEMPHDVAWEWKNEVQAESWQRLFKVTEYIGEKGTLQEKAPDPVFLNVLFQGLLDADQKPAMRLKALEKMWPMCADYAQKHGRQWIMGGGTLAGERERKLTALCVQAGEPDKTEKLLALLSNNQPVVATAPAPKRATTLAAQQNVSTLIAAPAWLKNRFQTYSMFRLSPPSANATEVKPAFQEIHFPAQFEIQSVLQLDFVKDKLLILAMDERSAQTSDANAGLGAELLDKRNRLWQLEPSATNPVLFEPEVFTQNIQGFLLKDHRLWVAGKTTGYLDLESHSFHKFGLSDGLAGQETRGIGAARDDIFACGESFDAFRYDAVSKHWTELPKPSGGYGWSGGEPFILTGNNRWLNFAQKDGSAFVYEIPSYACQNLSSNGSIQCSLATDNGFWFGGRDGLQFYDPTGKLSKSWPAPGAVQGAMNALMGYSYMGNSQISQGELEKLDGQVQGLIRKLASDRAKVHARQTGNKGAVAPLNLNWRIPGEVTALADDGDFLWLGAGTHLLLLHKPSNSLVANFAMPVRDSIASLALTKTAVWAGTAYGDHKLLKIPKDAFLSVPQNRWVSLAISPEERRRLINSMSVRDQAMYAFYAGNDTRVVELLGGLDPGKASLEEMFLLLFSYDVLGMDRPELMQAWAEHIRERFPDSPWAKAAQIAVSENEPKHKVKQHDAGLLAKYDLNHDSVLNAQEKSAMEKDPAYQRQEQAWNDVQLDAQLQKIMKKFDRNSDGKLDQDELASLRAQVILFSDAAPDLLAGRNIVVRPLLNKSFPTVASLLKQFDLKKTGGLDLAALKTLAQDLRSKLAP